MNSPTITLIIPSRERADVLLYALRTATAQDYQNLRILVSDNASIDNTKAVVESCTDPRVRYCNPGRRLSMSEHWNFALSQISEPTFVGFMGDDDGIIPGAISLIANLLEKTGLQLIRGNSADYYWPKRNQKQHGKLMLNPNGDFEIRDCRTWLNRTLKEGVPFVNLPVINNGGFVHTDTLEKIKHQGKHLHSAIPDLYSGIALATVTEKYGFTAVPFFVNGASQHSTGTSQFARSNLKANASGKTPAQRFIEEGNIPFHSSLPMLRNGHYPRSTRIMAFDAYLLSSFLRESDPTINHQQQLGLFFAFSGLTRNSSEINAWAEDFAKLNKLAIGRAKLASIPRLLKRYGDRKLFNRFKNLNTETYDAPQWPLNDVAAATEFAASRLTKTYDALRRKF